MHPFIAQCTLKSKASPFGFKTLRVLSWTLSIIVALLLATAASANTNTAMTDFDGQWRGVMTCAGTDAKKAFQANRRVSIKDGVLRFRKGKRGINRFEIWRGKVEPEGAVVVFGKYHWDIEKPLWFKGRIIDQRLTATGQRGPKTCELVLLKSKQTSKQ